MSEKGGIAHAAMARWAGQFVNADKVRRTKK
jgi:hypothetical protein